MSDLLTHAGVNSGSFYHFFKSKEELLRTVLESYVVAFRKAVVEPAFATTNEPIERIFAILAGYRERVIQTDYKYGCPIGRLALEIDPENRAARRLIAQNFTGWIGAIAECLDEIADRLPAGTDTEALATHVCAVMEGGVMLSRTFGSVEPFDRSVGQLRDYFGLLTKTGRRVRRA